MGGRVCGCGVWLWNVSVSDFRTQRAREVFSSPTIFFFFTFLLKRGWISCSKKTTFPGITGSQLLRLAGTSEDHPVQLPCSKQVLVNHIQQGLEYLQVSRLHSLSGQPVLGFGHLHSRKVFLMFPYVEWEFPHFSLCQFPLVPSVGIT